MATSTEEAISQREQLENQYDITVRQEIETFRTKAMAFLAGEITEADFRPFRLKHGIYGQRQAGVQMVRCKIPGGLLTPPQVVQLARVADEFGGGRGHLTTRQNIQYHFVALHQVADLMHLLADVGLTNREACYNTVRNVTACTWAGIARDEVFDVRRHQDCIQGAINDVGLRAVIRDGQRGFRMVIGGGLGPLPTEAQLLDEFVPEERLLNWCEAVIRVFNQYGNRQNKNTARMKFVMRTRGLAWMKEQIAKEYDDIVKNGGIEWPAIVPEGFGGYQSHPHPLGNGALLPVVGQPASGDPAYNAWLASNVKEQKQTGYAAVTVTVDQGNLTGDQFRGLARISATAGDGMLRTAINQNVVLAFVPLARLPQVYAALGGLGRGAGGAGQID